MLRRTNQVRGSMPVRNTQRLSQFETGLPFGFEDLVGEKEVELIGFSQSVTSVVKAPVLVTIKIEAAKVIRIWVNATTEDMPKLANTNV